MERWIFTSCELRTKRSGTHISLPGLPPNVMLPNFILEKLKKLNLDVYGFAGIVPGNKTKNADVNN